MSFRFQRRMKRRLMRRMEDLGEDTCREEKEEVEHGEVFDLLLIHLTSGMGCRSSQRCVITGDLLPDISYFVFYLIRPDNRVTSVLSVLCLLCHKMCTMQLYVYYHSSLACTNLESGQTPLLCKSKSCMIREATIKENRVIWDFFPIFQFRQFWLNWAAQ